MCAVCVPLFGVVLQRDTVVLWACVFGWTFLACACVFDGFLLQFLLVFACPLPHLFVTLSNVCAE